MVKKWIVHVFSEIKINYEDFAEYSPIVTLQMDGMFSMVSENLYQALRY